MGARRADLPAADEPFEQAACEAACQAGALLRERFRTTSRRDATDKGLHDYVTEADHLAEGVIVSYLASHFPEHSIIAEEGSPDAAREGYRWFVDPLDGTSNYIHGVPVFAVSVALEDPNGLLACAIHDPLHEELFHASRGRGARLNGAPIACSRPETLDESLIATGFPFRDLSHVKPYIEMFELFVRRTAGIRRLGSASLDLAYVACGRYDGFWEMGLNAWDVAAGALLVSEAGGRVTDLSGGDGFLAGDVVASGPTIHAQMLEVTRPQGR